MTSLCHRQNPKNVQAASMDASPCCFCPLTMSEIHSLTCFNCCYETQKNPFETKSCFGYSIGHEMSILFLSILLQSLSPCSKISTGSYIHLQTTIPSQKILFTSLVDSSPSILCCSEPRIQNLSGSLTSCF